ncbi:MAG: DUF72 domain-containing protein [Bdellovibrionia bacterium]
MDFGKLPSISGVDFSLPADFTGNAQLLNRLGATGSKPAVYTGAPVWSQKEWVGRIYPLGTRSQDYLKFYSQQFYTIELNTTHYRIPDEDTINNWRTHSEPGFKFCPKFPQMISHERMLQDAEAMTQSFCKSVMGLGDRLGRSFLQLPPQFSPAQLPVLRNFLETLPRGFQLAIEFRHPAWFSKGVLRSDVTRLLEIYGAVALITDVAGRRDVLHMSLTAPSVMVRFVGNSLHPTDYSRIDAWIGRLNDWISQGIREIYFFIHEPDNVQAPDLIQYFTQEINIRCGLELKPWVEMNQGSQMSLFG